MKYELTDERNPYDWRLRRFGEDSPLLGEVDEVIVLFEARIKSWEAAA